MRRFFGRIEKDRAIVEGEEFVHLKTVLRGKIGEEILIFDGSPNEYICKIAQLNKSNAVCEIQEARECKSLPKKNIVLF